MLLVTTAISALPLPLPFTHCSADSESERRLLPAKKRERRKIQYVYWTEVKPDCAPSSAERHQRYGTPQKQSHDLHLRQVKNTTFSEAALLRHRLLITRRPCNETYPLTHVRA